MSRAPACAFVLALVGGAPACGDAPPEPPKAESKGPRSVGYDLRRLRPKNEEKLADMFERLRTQALKEGKHVAVLFSADWCEPCRTLQLELGNMQPEDAIGHVRILELVEEDWEAATRLDEFEGLRARWYDQPASYPVFVVLDAQGGKVEEMKDAIERLEGAGVEPTVTNWFRGLTRAG